MCVTRSISKLLTTEPTLQTSFEKSVNAMSPPLTVPPISSLPSKSPQPQPVRFLANEISISVSSPASVGPPAAPPLPPSSPPSNALPPVDPKNSTGPSTRDQSVSVVPVAPEGANLAAVIRRLDQSIARRLFMAWRWHARQRHWKRLAHAKDEQIMFLLSKLEESQSRGITYCHRQRARRLLACWWAFVERRRAQRRAEAEAVSASLVKLQSRFVQGWRAATRIRIAERQAERHHATVVLQACMVAWRRHAVAAAERAKNMETRQKTRTLFVWLYAARLKAREARAAVMAADRTTNLATLAFENWRRETSRSRDLHRKEQTFDRRSSARLLFRILSSWHAAMHDRIACRLLEQGVFAIETIRSLILDNRRLAKLVDASLLVNDQVSQLRAASDINEKLLRRVLALVERPFGPHAAKRASKIGTDDCPDVFRRLASGEKRERRASREEAGDDEQGAKIRAVKAAMSDEGQVAVATKACKTTEKTWPKLGCLATTVISVSEGEFFSLLRHVNDAFVQELGWTSRSITQ